MGKAWVVGLLGTFLIAITLFTQGTAGKENKVVKENDLKVGEWDGMETAYLNKKPLMYWQPDVTKGRIYEIESNDAVLVDKNDVICVKYSMRMSFIWDLDSLLSNPILNNSLWEI